MSTTMTNVGEALAERMEVALEASLQVTKSGAAWRVTYSDERGSATAIGADPRAAAASVARSLGLV